MTAGLRRGLAAGLVAGLLAGLVALALGSAPLREAVALEEAAHGPAPHDDGQAHAHDPAPHDDGRDHAPAAGAGGHDHGALALPAGVERLLLPAVTALIGVALGGLFGLAFALARPRMRVASHWSAHLRLGAVAWTCLVLVPTLAYPADPPGAADPDTLTTRTTGWLVSVGLALAGAVVLWLLARRLADRSAPRRHLVVGGLAGLGLVALVTALPAVEPGAAVPGELVWDFRMASLATLTTLWLGIAVVSGLLWERSPDRAEAVA